QVFMRDFELIAFQKDEHLTLRIKKERLIARVMGDFAVSYVVKDAPGGKTRLLVKTRADYTTLLGLLLKSFMPLGDKIMMRRQLLNFKGFAERDAQAANRSAATTAPTTV